MSREMGEEMDLLTLIAIFIKRKGIFIWGTLSVFIVSLIILFAGYAKKTQYKATYSPVYYNPQIGMGDFANHRLEFKVLSTEGRDINSLTITSLLKNGSVEEAGKQQEAVLTRITAGYIRWKISYELGQAKINLVNLKTVEYRMGNIIKGITKSGNVLNSGIGGSYEIQRYLDMSPSDTLFFDKVLFQVALMDNQQAVDYCNRLLRLIALQRGFLVNLSTKYETALSKLDSLPELNTLDQLYEAVKDTDLSVEEIVNLARNASERKVITAEKYLSVKRIVRFSLIVLVLSGMFFFLLIYVIEFLGDFIRRYKERYNKAS